VWCCSHRRNRGTCSNPVQIPQAKLETAVLGAVYAALDDQVAQHALEVAIDELRRREQSAERGTLSAQLAELDVKIGRALDLAIELGDLDAAKERLRCLRAERIKPPLRWPRAQPLSPRSGSSCRCCEQSWPISRRRSGRTLRKDDSPSERFSVRNAFASTATVG